MVYQDSILNGESLGKISNFFRDIRIMLGDPEIFTSHSFILDTVRKCRMQRASQVLLISIKQNRNMQNYISQASFDVNF